MTFLDPPPRSGRADIIATLMRETLELMEEVMRLAAARQRTIGGRREALSAAAVMRLSARLARISGWLIGKSDGAPCDPASRSILAQAMKNSLDGRRHDQQADMLARRIDRLAANAVRLDAALGRKIAPSSDDLHKARP
ncbi:MAG: hypothetical protein KTR21_04030 [Rhodobacteraceae bacterium]|nr:hypothetical protein [Paracoccaceae bacterium]